jgi:CDP-paratose synthetase
MKILMTGATGFLGSHLAKKLVLERKDDLIVLKRTFSNLERIELIKDKVKFYDIDTIDLTKIFDENNIDLIIHTSTEYGRGSFTSNIIESNVVFPLRLLELFNKSGGKYFINTDTFFTKKENNGYSYLNGYVYSKRYFNELSTFLKDHVKLINMRLEHIYGPYDNDDKFTVQIIQRLLNNEEKIDLTPGLQLRDFVYVDDVVNAYDSVIRNIEEIKSNSIFEVGQGKVYSIQDFVTYAKSLTGSCSKLFFGSIPYRPNEIMYSNANITPIKDLGWLPLIDLKEGITLMINQLKGYEV